MQASYYATIHCCVATTVLHKPEKFKNHLFNSSGKKIHSSLCFLLLLIKFKLPKLETGKITN